jgi:hypothetical protein
MRQETMVPTALHLLAIAAFENVEKKSVERGRQNVTMSIVKEVRTLKIPLLALKRARI